MTDFFFYPEIGYFVRTCPEMVHISAYIGLLREEERNTYRPS